VPEVMSYDMNQKSCQII